MSTLTRNSRVQFGDSLRMIAIRELGDALRWPELAEVNQLRPPYIIASTNAADRQRATLIYGDTIRIPISSVRESVQTARDVLGIDCALPRGSILANEQGDWSTVSDHGNFAQAIAHRIKTPLGDLIAHPKYGSQVSAALGLKNIHVVQMMIIAFIRQALTQEPRIANAGRIQSGIHGDKVQVVATITPAAQNTPVDLNFVFPLSR